MYTRLITLQAWSSVRDQMTYRPSAPRLADVQAAVAKQGCDAKIALEAAHKTIDSTANDVLFLYYKLLSCKGTPNK